MLPRPSSAIGRIALVAVLGFGCARGHEPVRNRSEAAAPTPAARELRAPDVPYEPSPEPAVAKMLELAELREGDVVYDLGCGDGRIVIAAVKRPGVRGVCVDIDPDRIRESTQNARAAGVTERIRFLNQDLFETDLRDATVVTLFLWPKVNLKLRPKLLRELRPGTRVISYMHDMGDWEPDQTVPIPWRRGQTAIYLWKIPARTEH